MKKITKPNGRTVVTNGIVTLDEHTAEIRGAGKPTDVSAMPVRVPKQMEEKDRENGRIQ